MNETFKDSLCHIACLHSGDKWDKNYCGENMASIPFQWTGISSLGKQWNYITSCKLAYAPETGTIEPFGIPMAKQCDK